MNTKLSALIMGCIFTVTACAADINTSAQSTSQTVSPNSKLPPLASKATQDFLLQQCHSYVQKQSVWKTIKMTLGTEKAEKITNDVCQCASESAAKNITVAQAAALADEKQRSQVLLDLSSTAIEDCAQKIKF